MSVDSLGKNQVAGQYAAEQTQQTASTSKSKATGNVLPPSSGLTSSSSSSSTTSDLPSLEAPQTQSMGYAGLSLESLVTAIGNTERKQACAEGVDRLEKRGEEIAETNQERIDEMQKNLETMRKQKALGPFMEAFQWIGAILGTIASAVTMAVGVMTANPLLIAGAAIGMTMAIDSMVSLGTDGEHSISAGITKLAEKCGASEETAQWIAFGVQMYMTVASIVFSFGAGAANAASGTIKATTQAMNIASKVQSGLQYASAVNSIASASANIAGTVLDYKNTMSQAQQMDLQAILEDIKMAQEFEQAMLEAEMERSNELLGSVNDIIDEANTTAQTIMGGAPAMA